jgi:tetratricopeptide (TPR) repeat protein
MSFELAEQTFRKGDIPGTVRLCDAVLAANSGHAGALRLKGMSMAVSGRSEEAIRWLQTADSARPNEFLTLDWLHGALMATGSFQDAAAVGERALPQRPRDVRLLVSLSQAHFRLGDYPRAVKHLETARAAAPADAPVRRLLGQAYEKVKRNRDAVAEYREAIRLNPSLADAYDRANRILLEEGKFAAALKLCEIAFAAVPAYGQVHLQAAQALFHFGKMDLAENHAKKAVELDPQLADPVATWFQACGRNDAATVILEKSINDRPVQGRAYYGILKTIRVSSKDEPMVAKLEELVRDPRLTDRERFPALKALGKAAEDLGEYEAAMRRFEEAARVGKKLFGAESAFVPERLDAARESFLRLFDDGFYARNGDLGDTGSSPIFVIGMIRSGTTLVQQILTSHPSVGDAGEQPFWTSEFPHLVDLTKGELRRDSFSEARDRYLEVLKRFDPQSPVVANKWPMNYAHAGLLLVAYPRAKIVHVSRHPVDTALSIYMTDLGEPPPEFVYEKSHIVSVYRDYQTRMRHWNRVLPAGAIFSVRYEDLVEDQETWSRKMIDFCGLEWDDRCLSFFTGDRRINTPSMLQARRPIYRTSLGKWHRYEPWLGELAQLL